MNNRLLVFSLLTAVASSTHAFGSLRSRAPSPPRLAPAPRQATGFRGRGGPAPRSSSLLGVARGGSVGSGLGACAAPLWGVAGVAAMLLNAVRRVVPAALEPFSSSAEPLGAALWASYGAVVALMAYVEGYKAFHLKFSPMVVKRAMTLGDAGASPAHAALAPLYAMGLFHATPKRRNTSWGFLLGVFGIVKLVKKLSYPWRSVVDAGVVAGLTIGAASLLYHYARALAGIEPPADAALPMPR